MVNAIKGILITWLVSLPLLVFQLSLMLPFTLKFACLDDFVWSFVFATSVLM
jgi:hypothetical protein